MTKATYTGSATPLPSFLIPKRASPLMPALHRMLQVVISQKMIKISAGCWAGAAAHVAAVLTGQALLSVKQLPAQSEKQHALST